MLEARSDVSRDHGVSEEVERMVRWLGPGESPAQSPGRPPESLLESLPPGLVLDRSLDGPEGVEDWLVGLRDPRVSLAVIDAGTLASLPEGAIRRGARVGTGATEGARDATAGAVAGGLRAPVVAWGCTDAEAAEAALAAGANVAVRADARPAEARAALEATLDQHVLRAACRGYERDLRRQRSLSLKDDLTAAYNRRYFDRALDEEIARARRLKSSVALIFMDLDDLKSVNQRWGHAMGSAVLREAAARTIRSIRSIDKVVRYGGDEFCIILPGADSEGGREVAERIRADLAMGTFATDQTGGVVLTASFGIAAFPQHATDKTSLIAAADQAMFRIKGARKNGILVTGEDVA